MLKFFNRLMVIVCIDEVVVYAVIRVCREFDLKVGYDVFVIGFNELIFLKLFLLRLIIININVFYLGYYAVEMFIKEFEEFYKIYKRLIVQYLIVEGEICRVI